MTEYYTTEQQQAMIERKIRLEALELAKRQVITPKSKDRAISLIERLTQNQNTAAYSELSTKVQE